jgi:predicted dehydrogenase
MKIVVVGAGAIGKQYINFLKDRVEVGVVDNDQTKVDQLARVDGVKDCAIRIEESYGWDPDGYIIATPHNTHIDLVRNVLRSTSARILLEKPIATNLLEVDQFIADCSSVLDRVSVVCNLRFDKPMEVLCKNLSLIGTVFFARLNYGYYLPYTRPGVDLRNTYLTDSDQGEIILDNIQYIDVVRQCFGEVKSAMGWASNSGAFGASVDDHAIVIIKHETGITTELVFDYLRQVRQRSCEVLGEKGTLRWQAMGKLPEYSTVEVLYPGSTNPELLGEFRTDTREYDWISVMVQKFLQDVAEGTSSLQSVTEARENLRIVSMAWASMDNSETSKIIRDSS